jgi:hypothetical protein
VISAPGRPLDVGHSACAFEDLGFVNGAERGYPDFMRVGRLFVIVVALSFCGVAAAVVPPSASVSSTPSKAGERPVVVTLLLQYEMQCGYPGQGPVVISFPRQMKMPPALAASSVTVDGKPATKVAVDHHRVRIGLTKHTGIICDVLGPGTLTIVFVKAADLGNPSRAGTYLVRASNGPRRFKAYLVITHA